jgi:hypothetical protein
MQNDGPGRPVGSIWAPLRPWAASWAALATIQEARQAVGTAIPVVWPPGGPGGRLKPLWIRPPGAAHHNQPQPVVDLIRLIGAQSMRQAFQAFLALFDVIVIAISLCYGIALLWCAWDVQRKRV